MMSMIYKVKKRATRGKPALIAGRGRRETKEEVLREAVVGALDVAKCGYRSSIGDEDCGKSALSRSSVTARGTRLAAASQTQQYATTSTFINC